MSLSTAIVAAIETWPEASGVVSAQDGPHRLVLDVRAHSVVGLELNHLDYRLESPDRTDWTIDDLKAWGDRIAARVTYLMEPLVVLEVDSEGVEVELRSQSPTPRGQLKSFYEARLGREGAVRLLRLGFEEPDRRRKALSFQLSREVLERLADDLAECAPHPSS